MTDDQARAIAAAVIRLLLPQDRAEITVALNRQLVTTIEQALAGEVASPGTETG